MTWRKEFDVVAKKAEVAPVVVATADYSNCYEWFDGCNYCRVFNGIRLECTKQKCKTKEKETPS